MGGKLADCKLKSKSAAKESIHLHFTASSEGFYVAGVRHHGSHAKQNYFAILQYLCIWFSSCIPAFCSYTSWLSSSLRKFVLTRTLVHGSLWKMEGKKFETIAEIGDKPGTSFPKIPVTPISGEVFFSIVLTPSALEPLYNLVNFVLR